MKSLPYAVCSRQYALPTAYRLLLTAYCAARQHLIGAAETTQDHDRLRLHRLIVRGGKPYRQLVVLDVGIAPQDASRTGAHTSQDVVKHLAWVHRERAV